MACGTPAGPQPKGDKSRIFDGSARSKADIVDPLAVDDIACGTAR
jgi:hypothetical protein